MNHKNKCKKISIIIILPLLFLCCIKEKPVQDERQESKVENHKEKRDTLFSTSPEFGRPKNIEELRSWQNKVRENGDENSYNQLADYYSKNPDIRDEMIEYSETMIRKGHCECAVYYYEYVRKSNLQQKDKLIKKAIIYLKKLANEDMGFFSELARDYLSDIESGNVSDVLF
jgi:hypothetical protein